MNDDMIIKPATRQGVKPLVCFYSESGCGKTYSALLLARGFVGPTGKIVMVDTESGRGELYADVLPGGYDVISFKAPFSPQRHIQAIQAVEDKGAAVGILDSGSHEWEGIGGVLDMAAQNEEKNGKNLGTWRIPKMEHAKFLNRLLQSSIPWIVCLRAKYKTRQVMGTKEMFDSGVIKQSDVGKKLVLKDEVTTPIQAEDFIYEATLHLELLQNHTVIVTKSSHPTLRDCFPKDKDGMISISHGELLAKWCNSAGAPATPQSAAKAPAASSDRETKTGQLWTLVKPFLGDNQTWPAARDFLKANKVLADGQSIKGLTGEQLDEVISKIKVVIDNLQP